MIDLGKLVVDAEANATISVLSKTGAYNDAGEWVTGQPAEADGIRAVIQPASGQQLRDMPEGVRAQAQFILWSRFALALDNVVLYAGEQWRVVFEWPRQVEAGYTRVAIGKLGKHK